MRPNLPRSLLALGALCGALSAWPAHAQQAPAGWVRLPDPAPGTSAFAPAQLQAGEQMDVTFYPRTPLQQRGIDAWLADAVSRDAPPAGTTWSGPPQVTAATGNVASATRRFRSNAGTSGMAAYSAMSADKLYGRMVRWQASSEATSSQTRSPVRCP